MAVKVTIKHPTLGPDVELEVPGAGVVKNGGSVTLDADQEAHFYSITGMKVKDYYADQEDVKVEGTSEAKLPANTVSAPNVNVAATEEEGDK